MITNLRNRAIKAITSKLGSTDFLPIDYFIDTEARKVLGLPERPPGSQPYVGWLQSEQKEVKRKGKTSQAGIDLIKKWEGFRSAAYLCPANVLTIGYGHTENVTRGMVISQKEGEELLRLDLLKFEAAVESLVKVTLTQNQFDALVSFTFNVGIGAFRDSTLLRVLNQKQYQAAAEQFGRWVNAGSKRLPGLVNRRKEEKELFLS